MINSYRMIFFFIVLGVLGFFGGAAPAISAETDTAGADSVAVGEERSLAILFGQPEITVSADVGGQFINSMAENRVFDEDITDQVGVAGLRESVQTGRRYNRESLAAFERHEQAKAQSGQALGELLPFVSVRANRGYEVSEPSVIVDDVTGELLPYSRHIRTDATLTVSQPLFDLAAYLEWRRRKEKERARGESYRISDGDAYVSTIDSYLSLV